jgi:hypothetical protein
MKWLSKLFGSTSSPSQGSRLNSLKLAVEWGREIERSERRVMWIDASGVPLSVDLINGSLGLPVPTDEHAVRQFCRRIAEGNGGAIVSVDAVRVAEVPATQLIYKREKRPAYAYTGMLFLQFDGFGYVIVIAAEEQGMTGVREAVVTARLLEEGKLTVETYEGSWFQDPYDQGYKGCILRSLSDDEAYDSNFPDHPLSKIRRTLEDLQSSIRLDLSGLPSRGS